MHPLGPLEATFLRYRDRRDPAALAEVYDGASSRLLAVALHLSSTAAGAEDAVQETFLFAMQHPERWDETRPLFPWLLGILGNKLHKADDRGRRAPDPDRLKLPVVRGPDVQYEASETLARIEAAITELPQPYRAVVLLRLRNGLSPADIAVALGRKPSTVRAQLARGVEMLRKALPASVAALLIGTASAARGLDVARTTVLTGATARQRALRQRQTFARLRVAAIAAAGLAFVALATDALGTPAPVLPAASPAPLAENVETEAAEVQEVTLPATPLPALERTDARPSGTLTVVVRRRGEALPDAWVELEPIGEPACVFEHRTTSGRSAWRELVAGRPQPPATRRHGRTTAAGACTFAALTDGFWICRTLDAAEVVPVRPGAATTVELTVDEHAAVVRGVVLGPDERPVAGAALWQCDDRREHVGHEFARSDAQGRFVVAVGPRTTIGAHVAGYAPVGVTITEHDAEPYRDVVLRVAAAGAQLAGVVCDAAGRPLVGAEVEVGHPDDSRVVPIAREPVVLARSQRTRTDGDGRFRFASLVPGATVLRTRAGGHGIDDRVVALDAGAPVDVRIELPGAATLTGHVRDAAGAPIAGASVQVGPRGALGHRATVTGADGAYTLDDVPPGRPTVVITDYRGGFAVREFACAPGERATFDAVLQPTDLEVTGRVVDATGRPFARRWVGHWSLGNLQVARLDGDGRFHLRRSERDAALPYRIEVFEHDPLDANGALCADPCAMAPGPLPGAHTFELRLPAAVPADAWLHGRLSAAGGPPTARRLRLHDSTGRRVWRIGAVVPASDGTFAFGPLVAGTYRVVVDEAPNVSLGSWQVPAATSLDVGTVPLPDARAERTPPIAVRIAPLFPDGVTVTELFRLEVHDPDGKLVESRRKPASLGGRSDLFLHLPPGRYTLTATSESGLVATAALDADAAHPRHRALLLRFAPR